MWGFKRYLDPIRSNFIFSLIANKSINKKFNPNYKSPKGFDQVFLSTMVYETIINSTLEHDSYFCSYFPKSKPFPTKRIGNCFVGCIGPCNQSTVFSPCPKKCRPKRHPNWIYC